MGKTKDLSAFKWGMVVGARRTGVCLKTATLLGFSHLAVSCVYQEWSTTQRTSSQLDTTVGTIGVVWNAFETLRSPCPEELRIF